jgi:hypothetical protein
MRESKCDHRRWLAAGSVALVVVLGLAGCGSASTRADRAETSPAAKRATLANWRPRFGKNEQGLIADCLLKAPDNAFVEYAPMGRSIVAYLPHLLYYARAAYGFVSTDALAEANVYIFDSPSTAKRWARISRMARSTPFTDAYQVRRVGSAVSVWVTPPEVGATNNYALQCSTRPG